MFKKLTQANELVIKNALETNETIDKEVEDVDFGIYSAKAKARKYYLSCIDAKGNIEKLGGKPLLNLMKEKLGTWQLLQNIDEDDEDGIEEVLTNKTIFQKRYC